MVMTSARINKIYDIADYFKICESTSIYLMICQVS